MRRYNNFVREGICLPPVWEGLKQQLYLGVDSFVEKMQAVNHNAENKDDLKEVPRLQRRPIAKTLAWYEKKYENRDDAMAQVFFLGIIR